MVDISLMYTQDASTPFYQSSSDAVGVEQGGVVRRDLVRQKNEKSLRELLEEQDVGEFDVVMAMMVNSMNKNKCAYISIIKAMKICLHVSHGLFK